MLAHQHICILEAACRNNSSKEEVWRALDQRKSEVNIYFLWSQLFIVDLSCVSLLSTQIVEIILEATFVICSIYLVALIMLCCTWRPTVKSCRSSVWPLSYFTSFFAADISGINSCEIRAKAARSFFVSFS